MDIMKDLEKAAEYIKGRSRYTPEIGLILGSGLGVLGDEITDPDIFEYADIAVGAIGAPEGWSVVLARTERGQRVLRQAVDHGYVESHATQDANINLISSLCVPKTKKIKITANR